MTLQKLIGTNVSQVPTNGMLGTLAFINAANAAFPAPVGVALGTAALPSVYFTGDPNTGLYSTGADQLSVTTGGTERLRIDDTGQIEAVSLGTAAAPTYTWTGDPNTGIYSPGADQVAISTNGVERVKLGTSEVVFNDGGNDIDFRIEGDTNANLFFVDASTDRVGLGTSSPLYTFDCRGQGAFELYNASGGGNVLNFRPSLGGASKYNISISSYDHSSNGTGPADGLSINGFDGVSICTGNSTERTERLRVTQAGLVGIGTTSPATTLDVNGDVTITDKIIHGGNTNTAIRFPAADTVSVETGGSERARIDSSGRLLVGTSTSRGIASSTNSFIQVETTGSFGFSIAQNSNNVAAPVLSFGKSRGTAAGGTTIVQSGDDLGAILFAGADGTNLQSRAASIVCAVDGTPGADDMPGRLVFSVTADGSASPTEALRISNNRAITVSDGGNVVLGTTTGTKIGTATTQKLGFYNATPVVQPAAVADATTAVDVITQLNDLLAKLRTLGIIAT